MNVASPEPGILFWTAVTAIATALMSLVLTIGGIFAYRQLREAARARRMQSALAVFDHISSPDYRNARRFIYSHHEELATFVREDPSWEALDEFLLERSAGRTDLDRFHSYLAAIENLSMLVLHDFTPDDMIEMYWGRMAARHWADLGPFITFMRQRYHSDDFLQHFEMLWKLMEAEALRLDYVSGLGRWKRLWRKTTDYSGRTKRELLRERREARKLSDYYRRIDDQYRHTEAGSTP